MFAHKTEVRNREIFAAYQRGEPTGNLAKLHKLSEKTVDEIIRVERHKIAVSVDAFYEEMRSQNTGLQS
jgi:Mor family transcriptional regulator